MPRLPEHSKILWYAPKTPYQRHSAMQEGQSAQSTLLVTQRAGATVSAQTKYMVELPTPELRETAFANLVKEQQRLMLHMPPLDWPVLVSISIFSIANVDFALVYGVELVKRQRSLNNRQRTAPGMILTGDYKSVVCLLWEVDTILQREFSVTLLEVAEALPADSPVWPKIREALEDV